jgi:hypothetical protein
MKANRRSAIMSDAMTRAQALAQARHLWGAGADVEAWRGGCAVFGPPKREDGVEPVFTVKGLGETWELAFANAEARLRHDP